MHALPKSCICAALGVLLAGAPAGADPVELRGSMILVVLEGPFYDVRGDGFSLRTTFDAGFAGLDEVGLAEFFQYCRSGPLSGGFCTPGESIQMGGSTTGEADLGWGTLTVNEATLSPVRVRFQGTFLAEPVVAPLPPEPPDFIRLSTPFQFSGSIRALLDGVEVFQRDLVGSGLATIQLEPASPELGFGGDEQFITYTFEDPAAVPEPSTVLLLGSGLATLIARRRSAPGTRRHPSWAVDITAPGRAARRPL